MLTADETRLIPLPVLARRLRVTVRWLRGEAAAGRLPAVRADKQYLFDSKAVERVLLARAAGNEGLEVSYAR